MYKQVIAKEPLYVDAYLRLSHLCVKRGDVTKGINYAHQGHKRAPKFSMNTLTAIANAHMARNDMKSALKEFEKISSMNKKDCYSRINVGNLIYESSVHLRGVG